MGHLWSHWMCSQQPYTHPLITHGFRGAHLAPGLVPARRSSWVGSNPPSSMWALKENSPSVLLQNKPLQYERSVFTFPVMDSSGSLWHSERGQNQERMRAGLAHLTPTS